MNKLFNAAAHLSCRHCATPIRHVMVDLGMQPLSNAIRRPADVNGPETTYPLRAVVCENCLLVQAPSRDSAQEIFSAAYPYFSSVSQSWLDHARRYAGSMMQRFGIGAASQVVEIACNDGYLLRWFQDAGVPVFGVEPTAGTAKAAQVLGIPVEMRFFGKAYATELRDRGLSADLMPANNVVAHVPDINDFVSGFTTLLKPAGVATFEFHHLLNLLQEGQFDTIYHEHYYYHSLGTFSDILARNGLTVFDVEELPTHGGSLRVYAQRTDSCVHPTTTRVGELLAREAAAGLRDLRTYLAFGERVSQIKRDLLTWLIQTKNEGKTIAGYGAPAKANTLLNYLGARTDFFEYTVDDTAAKQGCFLPGTTIPISAPERLLHERPDVIVILAWNWEDEIRRRPQVMAAAARGARVVTLSPSMSGRTSTKAVREEAAQGEEPGLLPSSARLAMAG